MLCFKSSDYHFRELSEEISGWMFISCLHLSLMQVQKKHPQLILQYLGLSLPQNICLLSQSFLLTPHHHPLLVSSMLLCPFILLLVNMFEYQNQQDGKRRVHPALTCVSAACIFRRGRLEVYSASPLHHLILIACCLSFMTILIPDFLGLSAILCVISAEDLQGIPQW